MDVKLHSVNYTGNTYNVHKGMVPESVPTDTYPSCVLAAEEIQCAQRHTLQLDDGTHKSITVSLSEKMRKC